MRHARYYLHHGDSLDWLQDLDSESVDLVITDPPYESLEKHRAVGTTTRLKKSKGSSNEWFPVIPNRQLPTLFSSIFRVLKKNTHFYLFCDAETSYLAKPIGESVGFRFWKPLVWDKERIGMGYHYRARYEFILFFEKGKRKLRDLGVPDVLRAPRIFNGYPTEKPSSLSGILITQSSHPENIVLDPFCGSGSTGVAAIGTLRHFLGGDVSQKALEITEDKLQRSDGVKSSSLLQSRMLENKSRRKASYGRGSTCTQHEEPLC